ncbi:MAG: hypothetical protein IPH46_09960 [Bacteroidetes bacterium]|nr:hypothetical protein [Bacteroidota bacterium]
MSEILSMYKEEQIDLYTLFNKLNADENQEILQGAPCHTSWMQYVPYINKIYKVLLPLMPFAIQHLKSEGC